MCDKNRPEKWHDLQLRRSGFSVELWISDVGFVSSLGLLS